MTQKNPYFISEISSNHGNDLERCLEFISASASIGAQAVKFQLFKIDELFSPEILAKSEEHRRRKEWELNKNLLPEIKEACQLNKLDFSCTPFYLKAVEELFPFVDFYKIASYELLWDELISECAKTKKPLIISTGMANLDEITHAAEIFNKAGGTDLTLLHCVSGYPAPPQDCNLKAIETIRTKTGLQVGWSDHSRNPKVINRAIQKWGAPVIEFHLDLDEKGAEYAAGHCWLPNEISEVIKKENTNSDLLIADGTGTKEPTPIEISDREWRADPEDGLRPLKHVRTQWL